MEYLKAWNLADLLVEMAVKRAVQWAECLGAS